MPNFPSSGGDGATGTKIPAPNAVPESLIGGQLDAGWAAPSFAANERYVSPDGDDSNEGDDWTRPLLYVKTAWEQLRAIGGGTIYFADQSRVSADSHGLHIAGSDGVLPVNAVLPMSARIVGCSSGASGGFEQSPPARLYGGAPRSGTVQDDPAIWISASTTYPIRVENVRFQEELNKDVRIGWDYARDDSGEIITTPVTAASRAAGSTVFTCDPIDFNIVKIGRSSGIVTVILGNRPLQLSPIRRGASVYVDFTSGDFTPGTFTVLESGGVVDGAQYGFTFLDAGVNFSTGSSIGTAIGTASSNCAAPNDFITLYGGTSEFPASSYMVTAVSATTCTVDDYYGYSPRSAAASDTNIGTMAAQDRFSFNTAKISLSAVSGRLINDATVENFANGPGMDIGALEFFQFDNIGIFGNNMSDVAGQPGCRDPNRRCAILINTGNGSAGTGFGTIDQAPIAYGGIRYFNTVNGSVILSIKNVCVDQPIVGFHSTPAVELLQVTNNANIYLENISLVDSDPSVAAVKINRDAPYGAVMVNGVFGLIDGPCTITNAGLPQYANSGSQTPNALGQTGFWGRDRLIAGRHPGTYRNGNIASNPLLNMGVPRLPADWYSVTGGVTVTAGVRDPFGGNNAIRLTSAIANQSVIPYAGFYSSNGMVGDIAVAAMWVRGAITGNKVFNFDVRYTADNTPLLNKEAFLSRIGGGEWSLIAVGGRLEQSGGILPTFQLAAVLEMILGAGDSIDVYEPTIYCLRQTEDASAFANVSDVELSEIITNIKTSPAYLNSGLVGTHYGQKFISHGGLGTDSTNAKVVGVGSGDLTLTGSGTKYLPMYDTDGTTIIGWVAQLQATINP